MTWTPPEHPGDPGVWIPCGTCWGQRTVFTTSRGGLVPAACPSCLGLGERLPDGAAPAP